ncbi:hypothetical protein Emtol_2065 [Emticicia oligotrophica DSM 17448]|uniref:Glycosyl transferase family 2 n=1 Tax=Emticicia oligotrophica (strain DSM 17448 / CIP 109782 / MTCC 6937 / GPTSA100-15) TaxID=929562 RepID=A0ABM5N1F6_EMTOG|nr:hypothetical protein [Emticicia oligotrophica]AFK03204.1 hypothetical protein Emtol_2065 [Emticicia oligotrophica DSM 17448]
MFENTQLPFSILINTSDNFEDCWSPFFLLFSKNWKECQYPIYLNTEFKEFNYPSLNIISTKVHEKITNRKLTWSECLIRAVEKIETPLILYFQEDYFLDQEVNTSFIQNIASKMLENEDVKRIGLIETDSFGKLYPTEDPNIWEVSHTARYITSTQVSLWRKEALLKYLKPEENGWMFEIFGTWRARKNIKDKFLTINRDKFSGKNRIVSYIHTGIIKGKWHPAIPELFSQNSIQIDFSKRGFYNLNISTIKRKIETFNKLTSSTSLLLKAVKERLF